MEYLEKSAIMNALMDEQYGYLCEDAINAIPAADVVPVRHGRWEWDEHKGCYYCSECGSLSPWKDQDGEDCDCPNYCPNCGAKMK